jgi:hypothetical protein
MHMLCTHPHFQFCLPNLQFLRTFNQWPADASVSEGVGCILSVRHRLLASSHANYITYDTLVHPGPSLLAATAVESHGFPEERAAWSWGGQELRRGGEGRGQGEGRGGVNWRESAAVLQASLMRE